MTRSESIDKTQTQGRRLGLAFAIFGFVAPIATLVVRPHLPNFRYTDPVLHSAIEAMGAFVALVTGVMLSVLHRQFHWTEKFRWAACSLIAMGVLSSLHSFFGREGHALVTLEFAYNFCGAILASCCWFSRAPSSSQRNFTREYLVALGSLALGIGLLLTPSSTLTVLDDQRYNDFAGFISTLSSVLFVGAAVKFFHDYRKDGKVKCLYLGAFFLLSGVSSVFPVSFYPWGPLWWSWHFLKLTGYFAALSLVGAIAIRLEKQLEESERRTSELLAQAVMDIEARKCHEAEIQALTESLTRSNEDLRRFGHILSHDMQQPLRMITSYLALLERKLGKGLDSESCEFLNYATNGARQLHSLIVELLKYSELERMGGGIELVPVELEQLVKNVTATIGPLIAETDTTVLIEPLPTVTSQPVLLHTVLQNLIVNAIKYRSERRPKVVVSAQTKATEFVVSVKDNGIGIEPKFQDCIFEPLRRLHGPEIEGTGMGLASTKRIIERLGGKIWLESTPGHGTTFSFTIPRNVTTLKTRTAESNISLAQ